MSVLTPCRLPSDRGLDLEDDLIQNGNQQAAIGATRNYPPITEVSIRNRSGKSRNEAPHQQVKGLTVDSQKVADNTQSLESIQRLTQTMELQGEPGIIDPAQQRRQDGREAKGGEENGLMDDQLDLSQIQ